MTESASGSAGVARWGTAAGLALAVVLLSALDSLPLVFVPLALIMLTVALERRWRWIVAGLALGMLGLTTIGGPLGQISRAWALLLGGAFVLVAVWRPGWGVLPRALAAVGAAAAAGGLWVGLSGGWQPLDTRVREELVAMADRTFEAARQASPESPWVGDLAEAARQMAELQANLFPGLLALQSLAALGLASWLVARFRRREADPFTVRPWREFRFNDQLVWLLIAGLALMLLPLGAVATRLGYNAVVFMAALYALRGVGVFLFLSVGASSLFMIVFGTLAAVFLYPLILGAAILIGLGDTWLDVRGRAVAASRS
ncbi:MAG TPA: DUF2232 domain-containing protein [Longimicrobiaceae bacterium]